MADRFYSPLRYPGGKAKLVPFIKSLFHENNLVGCEYIEPFAGGAGVALSLLFGEYASTVTINDFDLSIYAFWHSVKHKNDHLCERIDKIALNIETWNKQKKIQNNKKDASLFDLGFSTFYLNRTNISGIIKGGVIGGKNQSGKYKIDARFNKKNLISRIEKIGQYGDRIKVQNKDALEILKEDNKNRFVYLDPPYVKKAKDLYMNFYNKNDHKNISLLLISNKINFSWLLSYDNDELINNLYRSYKQKLSWKLGYGSSKKISKELLFASEDIKLNRSIEVIKL